MDGRGMSHIAVRKPGVLNYQTENSFCLVKVASLVASEGVFIAEVIAHSKRVGSTVSFEDVVPYDIMLPIDSLIEYKSDEASW